MEKTAMQKFAEKFEADVQRRVSEKLAIIQNPEVLLRMSPATLQGFAKLDPNGVSEALKSLTGEGGTPVQSNPTGGQPTGAPQTGAPRVTSVQGSPTMSRPPSAGATPLVGGSTRGVEVASKGVAQREASNAMRAGVSPGRFKQLAQFAAKGLTRGRIG